MGRWLDELRAWRAAERLNQDDASKYLAETTGVKTAPATLAKLRSVGGGPAFLKIGQSVVYERLALDEWAASKIRNGETMNRLFDKTTINVPGARPQPAYLIQCSKCGETEKVTTSTNGRTMAPEGIAAKFRNIGWIVGSRQSHDICPKCQPKREGRYTPFTIPKPMEPPVSEVVTPIDAPREMSKADRRVILAKIEDVYLDETSGYSAGWSDQKVAEDLGVPRAWVKTLREENFGSEGASEEVVKLLADAKALGEQFEKAKEKAMSDVSKADAAIRKFASQIDDIVGRVKELEKRFK